MNPVNPQGATPEQKAPSAQPPTPISADNFKPTSTDLGELESFVAPKTSEPSLPSATPVPKSFIVFPDDIKSPRKPLLFLQKNGKKIALISGSAIGLVVLVIAGIFAFNKFATTPIIIGANIQAIDIVVDGNSVAKAVNTPYTLKLKAGKHLLAVSNEDYLEGLQEITVDPLKKNAQFDFTLKEKAEIKKVLEKEVFFPAYNKETKVLYYFFKNDAGYILSQYNTATATEVSLINKPIAEIRRVAWSPTYKQVIATVVNSAQPQGGLLQKLSGFDDNQEVAWVITLDRRDLVNVKTTSLHPSIRNATFNPDGDRIVYYFKGENRSLTTSDPSGAYYEPLATFRPTTPDSDLSWSPDGVSVAVFPDDTVSPDAKRNVKFYSFAQRATTDATTDDQSTGAVWSPDSQYFVYQSGSQLLAYDTTKEKDNALDLQISGDFHHVVWTGNTSLIVYNQEGLWELKISASNVDKKLLAYKKRTLPANISTLVFDPVNTLLYLFSDTGIIEFVPAS